MSRSTPSNSLPRPRMVHSSNDASHHQDDKSSSRSRSNISTSGQSNSAMKGVKDIDVLCGRGGLANNHPGNHIYRRIVNENKPLYQACDKKTHKYFMSLSIIVAVQRQGGRFMKQEHGQWTVISQKEAIAKTSQALREQDAKTKKSSSSSTSRQKRKSGQHAHEEEEQKAITTTTSRSSKARLTKRQRLARTQSDGSSSSSNSRSRRQAETALEGLNHHMRSFNPQHHPATPDMVSSKRQIIATADVGIPYHGPEVALFDDTPISIHNNNPDMSATAPLSDEDDDNDHPFRTNNNDKGNASGANPYDNIVLFADELDDLLLKAV